jgi:hypothetical protein
MLSNVFPRVRMARLGFGGHPATGLLRRAGRAGIIQRTALDAPHAPARSLPCTATCAAPMRCTAKNWACD